MVKLESASVTCYLVLKRDNGGILTTKDLMNKDQVKNSIMASLMIDYFLNSDELIESVQDAIQNINSDTSNIYTGEYTIEPYLLQCCKEVPVEFKGVVDIKSVPRISIIFNKIVSEESGANVYFIKDIQFIV